MNKRKKKWRNKLARMKEKRLQAMPAKASDYLYHLAQYHKDYPNISAIIYCRKSIRANKANLDTDEKLLRSELGKLDIPILKCFREVSSGYIFNPEQRDALTNSVKLAKCHNNDKVVIVAASSDRFLRNELFHTIQHPDILPTISDFIQLRELTCGVPLLTFLEPDMPPFKVRSYQIKWGQNAKNRKGGRPKKKPPGYKKKRRLKKMPRVLQFYEEGMSLGNISVSTGVPKTTVADWVKKYRK